MKKTFFALLLLAIFPTTMIAQDFIDTVKIGSIYYELNTPYYDEESESEVAEAYVVSGEDKYSGEISIPSNVTYNNVNYQVVAIGIFSFYNNSELTSITIPQGVTEIGMSAFSNCTGLTSISIPNSVVVIGGGAFENCSSLTSITIPDKVTEIGHYAFNSCENLTNVTCQAIVIPETGDYIFDNSVEQATLYVPQEALETYRKTNPWSDFKTILPLPEE